MYIDVEVTNNVRPLRLRMNTTKMTTSAANDLHSSLLTNIVFQSVNIVTSSGSVDSPL